MHPPSAFWHRWQTGVFFGTRGFAFVEKSAIMADFAAAGNQTCWRDLFMNVVMNGQRYVENSLTSQVGIGSSSDVLTEHCEMSLKIKSVAVKSFDSRIPPSPLWVALSRPRSLFITPQNFCELPRCLVSENVDKPLPKASLTNSCLFYWLSLCLRIIAFILYVLYYYHHHQFRGAFVDCLVGDMIIPMRLWQSVAVISARNGLERAGCSAAESLSFKHIPVKSVDLTMVL